MTGKRKHNLTVKRALVCVILLAMPVRSVAGPQTPRPAQGSRLSENARVRAALDWFSPNISSVNEQQARLTEIPAPPFQESRRASAVKELLIESGLRVEIDKTGNVIGELRGANEKEIVVIAAHLDTVFPAGTDVKVRRENGRMAAPIRVRAASQSSTSKPCT